jgi:hypothetical protein
MILESSAAEATRRLRDSGVTVCEVTIISLGPHGMKKLGYGIRIDGEDVFIKSGINANHVAHLVVDL